MGRMPKKNQPLGKRDPDRHKKTAAGVADRAHSPGQTRPRGGIRPGTSWQTQNRFTVLAVCGLLLLAVGSRLRPDGPARVRQLR